MDSIGRLVLGLFIASAAGLIFLSALNGNYGFSIFFLIVGSAFVLAFRSRYPGEKP